MLSWWHYLFIFGVALVVTVALVPAVRHLAVRLNAIDQPGSRRVNTEPIPRMGGLAMFAGVVAALLVELACECAGVWDGPFFLGPHAVFNTKLIGVIAGLTFVVIVGAIDDVRPLPPGVKFVGQIIAACIIAGTGTLLSNFKLPFSDHVVSFGMGAYPITVIYLVCFANIINLIDGLDGLAAGITGIAALSLFILTFGLMRDDAALAAIILLGVCVGFLFFNFNPASIFMGDSGSLLLGMMLGTVSLLGAARFSSVTALAVPVIIAAVPVIDTFGAIVRRLRGHQSIATADAGHIHHRLLRRGFSQRKAVLIIYAWTAFLSLGACFIWSVAGPMKYITLVVMFVASAFIVWHLGLFGPVLQHHYYQDDDSTPKDDSDEDGKASSDADEGGKAPHDGD